MSRIAYVNGTYLPIADANISIEDRGYQFSDGIYEYFAVYNHVIVDEAAHLERLQRSLAALSIPSPVAPNSLPFILKQLIASNTLLHGGLYLQITRGTAPRNHPFPANARASMVITFRPLRKLKHKQVLAGVNVITLPDLRWARCDIKSIALLPNVLAKQEAVANNAYEAWQIKEDGFISEGAVSNAFIVRGNVVVTHPLTPDILPGITRNRVLALAEILGMEIQEIPFTLEEALAADEAFLTSSSSNVLPVTHIDGKPIGTGKAGVVTLQLLEAYRAFIFEQTGYAI